MSMSSNPKLQSCAAQVHDVYGDMYKVRYLGNSGTNELTDQLSPWQLQPENPYRVGDIVSVYFKISSALGGLPVITIAAIE